MAAATSTSVKAGLLFSDSESEENEEVRPERKRPKLDPCDYEAAICSRCRRSGERCARGRAKIKFRHGSSARYDSSFAKDQTWLKIAGKARQFEYVDETGDLIAFYAHGEDVGADSDTGSVRAGKSVARGQLQSVHVRTSSKSSDGHHRNITSAARSTAPNTPVIPEADTVDASYSPPHQRMTNDSDFFSARRNSREHNHTSSLSSISPSLSVLNIHSPVPPQRLSFSGSARVSTPFDYASLLGLPGKELASLLAESRNVPFQLIYQSPEKGSLLKGLVEQSSIVTLQQDPTRLQAVLLRYFVENLAHWFDLCDPERHFALVVPQRARSSPPLLNAILTASARHLTRLTKYRTDSGVIVWQGCALPDLKTETALQYHNECIKDLIQLSMDPDQVYNENLLAAAIILRFYEEVDAPLRENDDEELFLRVINIFINAQAPVVPTLPHSSPQIHYPVLTTENLDQNDVPIACSTSSNPTPPTTTPSLSGLGGLTPRVPRADGLRQAAFWVGFRQEIYTSFMKQRPFAIPLSRCDAFRTFSPAEDAVWAARLIIFCADVLAYCHGDLDAQASRARWLELSRSEKMWSQVLPSSFKPIYSREPLSPLGEVFPEIWYLADCHVAGVQHVELARILLGTYDPTRPRMGPGHLASMKELSQELKGIVLRLCGIALSNRKSPPGLVTACMGIAMCGEHFTELVEQVALLGVLAEMDSEHAWPAVQTAETLKQAWGWE